MEEALPLLRRIRRKRQSIQMFLERREPASRRLTNINIVFGAIATALTVTPAVGGKTFLAALGVSGSDPATLRILFGLAAAFSLLSTITAGLYKAYDMAARIAKAQACSARLEGLEARLELAQISIKEAVEKYTAYISTVEFIHDRNTENNIELTKGEIKDPIRGQVVTETINCSGWAEDLAPGYHLWLATEIKSRIWPKECAIRLDENGAWASSICEEGTVGDFSLSLFVADQAADRKIRDWLKVGNKTGNYKELRRPSGIRRLHRVDGLHKTAQS